MAAGSSIEWTEATWNPVTGCTKISPGCKHCYAERMAMRLKAMGVPQYRNGFRLTLQRDALDIPLKWKRPRLIFVNSMSDLFHQDVPLEFIQRVFAVMEEASQHQFQVLTKRPEIALEYAEHLPWPANVWTGTSIENALYLDRVRTLRGIPAKIRFLSVEPLLGPIPRLPLAGIHWVIVAGESGPGARPMEKEWVTQFAIDVLPMACRFFSNSGGERTRRKLDVGFKVAPGMSYRIKVLTNRRAVGSRQRVSPEMFHSK